MRRVVLGERRAGMTIAIRTESRGTWVVSCKLQAREMLR